MMSLNAEYGRLKTEHGKAVQIRAARVVLGASGLRVFVPDTKEELLKALIAIPAHDLRSIRSDAEFRGWFERNLNAVDRAI